MPEAAVEMSWGRPESIRRTLEGQQVHQEWTYPGGKRRVFITDGLVTRVDEGTPRRGEVRESDPSGDGGPRPAACHPPPPPRLGLARAGEGRGSSPAITG